jgi:hypothetical protein
MLTDADLTLRQQVATPAVCQHYQQLLANDRVVLDYVYAFPKQYVTNELWDLLEVLAVYGNQTLRNIHCIYLFCFLMAYAILPHELVENHPPCKYLFSVK